MALNTHDSSVTTDTLAFTIIGEDESLFREVRADVTVVQKIEGVAVPLTYHIHCDDLGNPFINATYKSPITGREATYPITDYRAVYRKVDDLVTKLVAEKTTSSY